MIGAKTPLLALIGNSLSLPMHNASFAAENLDYIYVALDVEPKNLPAAVAWLRALGFVGFNVTMPHKRAVLPLLDDLDDGARFTGAVNTVVVDGPELRGYNTDGGGLVEACREAGVGLAGRRVLLLGAGAAANAFALDGEGVRELRIVNRTTEPAKKLSEKLRGAGLKWVEGYPHDALGETIRDAEVIVNPTPPGMKAGGRLPVPVEHLSAGSAVCDAVSRPGSGDRADPGSPRLERTGRHRRADAAPPGRAGAEALDRAARGERLGDERCLSSLRAPGARREAT